MSRKISKTKKFLGIILLIVSIGFILVIKLRSPLPEGVVKDNVIHGNILECKTSRGGALKGTRKSYVSMRINSVNHLLTGTFYSGDDIYEFKKDCLRGNYVEVRFTASKLIVSSEVSYRLEQVQFVQEKRMYDFVNYE